MAARFDIGITCMLACLAGCASAPERPAVSTVGCAEAVVATLPPGLDDRQRHCMASAGIARQCSPFEAWLSGWGKEAMDALGAGDAAREDLAANRIGRRCASQHPTADAVLECCRRALPAAASLSGPSGSRRSATAAPAGRD